MRSKLSKKNRELRTPGEQRGWCIGGRIGGKEKARLIDDNEGINLARGGSTQLRVSVVAVHYLRENDTGATCSRIHGISPCIPVCASVYLRADNLALLRLASVRQVYGCINQKRRSQTSPQMCSVNLVFRGKNVAQKKKSTSDAAFGKSILLILP